MNLLAWLGWVKDLLHLNRFYINYFRSRPAKPPLVRRVHRASRSGGRASTLALCRLVRERELRVVAHHFAVKVDGVAVRVPFHTCVTELWGDLRAPRASRQSDTVAAVGTSLSGNSHDRTVRGDVRHTRNGNVGRGLPSFHVKLTNCCGHVHLDGEDPRHLNTGASRVGSRWYFERKLRPDHCMNLRQEKGRVHLVFFQHKEGDEPPNDKNHHKNHHHH